MNCNNSAVSFSNLTGRKVWCAGVPKTCQYLILQRFCGLCLSPEKCMCVWYFRDKKTYHLLLQNVQKNMTCPQNVQRNVTCYCYSHYGKIRYRVFLFHLKLHRHSHHLTLGEIGVKLFHSFHSNEFKRKITILKA